MVRAPCFDKHGIKKGAWSEDEDSKLRAYIETYGHLNWRELPKLAGLSRCGKSCRLRWMNYLRPNVKHGNFTKEEEDVITSLHNKFGNKWSTMAARLPGRSDNEIKNHWHAHLKSRAREDQTVVLKSKQVGIFEPVDAKPKECVVKEANLKPQQKEFEVLLAVLSSEGPSSSSTSESSSCSLSVSDYAVPSDVTPQVSISDGNLWSEPFFPDNMFSSLGFGDDLISQTCLQDYIIDDDVFLWSTLD